MILLDIVCVVFMGACFCRLYKLNPEEDKLGWGVMYGLVLAGDVSVWAEVRNGDENFIWAVVFFFLAWLLNFWLTHKQWLQNNGAPAIVKQEPPKPPMEEPPHFVQSRLASMSEVVEHIP